jgi:hypothetical protein
MSAMNDQAEADLPAAEGPGVGADQTAAVERNNKAVYFLITAMPDSIAIGVLVAGTAGTNWPTQPKAHLMMTYLKETFNYTVEKAASIHVQYEEEELVERNLLNGIFDTYCDDAQIDDYEDEKGPELEENDCVFFAKLDGMIEELRTWKFDPNYGEEEVILGDGDGEMSEVTGREWERQGEKDPDEELSDLIEEYSLESMMAEENDDGNQDEEASLENDGTESGEESSTFDSEEAHSEEHGESKGRDGRDGGEDNNVFCERLEDVMMGLEMKNANANANLDVDESQGVAKIESSEGTILGRTKKTIKAPGRLINKKNVLCAEKTKIGWKEFLIKVDDEALKTMDKLIKWEENVVAREEYFVSDGDMAADKDPQARGSVGLRENGDCFDEGKSGYQTC